MARTSSEARHPIPPRLRKVFREDRKAIREWLRRLDIWMASAGPLSQRSGCDLIDFEAIAGALSQIRDHVDAATPYRPCFLCRERGEKWVGCVCQGKEWLTHKQFVEAIQNDH